MLSIMAHQDVLHEQSIRQLQLWGGVRPAPPLRTRHVYVTGQRFPTLAGARSRISVDSCRFVNNTCAPGSCSERAGSGLLHMT